MIESAEKPSCQIQESETIFIFIYYFLKNDLAKMEKCNNCINE